MKIFRRIWAKDCSIWLLHDGDVRMCSESWSWSVQYSSSWSSLWLCASGRTVFDAHLPWRRRWTQRVWAFDTALWGYRSEIILGKAHE